MQTKEKKASSRQTFAIFCASGLDVRGLNLSKDYASGLLDDLNGERREAAIATLQSLGASGTVKEDAKTKARKHRELYDRALAAGQAAAAAHEPTPMIVQQRANALDDTSPVVKEWTVRAGVCGFAWVRVKPANSSFAKWAIKEGLARTDSYRGGIILHADGYGQSMELKEAHARAMAEVLRDAGLKAFAESRID